MSNIQREVTDIISALKAWEDAGVNFRQISLNIIANLREKINIVCQQINDGENIDGWPEILVNRMSK